MTQPVIREDTERRPSRLERDTAERQDMDELVADGLLDEANVEESVDLSPEERALVVEEAAANVEEMP